MSDKKTLKILKEALSVELWAITIYEDILSRIGDKKIRKVIAGIIDDSEIHHVRTLRKAVHKLILEMPIKQKLSKKRLKELMNACLREESEMKKNCKKLINRKNIDKKLKINFKRIFNDEVEHENKIKKLINSI